MANELPPRWQELTTTVGNTLRRFTEAFGCGTGDIGPDLRLLVPMDFPHPLAPATWLEEGGIAATAWRIPIERSATVNAPLLIIPLQ